MKRFRSGISNPTGTLHPFQADHGVKTISNNIIHYKLLALIPLALTVGGIAWWDVSEKGGLLIPILIAVAGIISFIVVLFKTENTVILTYNTENGTVHIQKNKELIVVPIHDILSFRKEVDFQHSYLDFLKENYTVYGVTLLHDGKKRTYSFAIWDSQKTFQTNYRMLRFDAITARKKYYANRHG